MVRTYLYCLGSEVCAYLNLNLAYESRIPRVSRVPVSSFVQVSHPFALPGDIAHAVVVRVRRLPEVRIRRTATSDRVSFSRIVFPRASRRLPPMKSERARGRDERPSP